MIGAGFFASIQAEAWSRIANVELSAVADPDVARANEFAKKWGIPTVFPDAESLIRDEQPSFVDIATRPETHLDLVRIASNLGCDCICQKPMAPTLSECEQMVAICRKNETSLLIHENWRWQPWYRAAKQAIDECGLGKIFGLNFRVRTGDGFGPEAYTVQPYFTEMKRFLIFETLIHHLDTARFIAGEVKSLFCQTKRINPKITGEDYAIISLQFLSGASGTIDANRINGEVPAPMVFGLLEVECEQGVVRIDSMGKVWTRLYARGPEEVEYTYQWSNQGYRGDSVHAVQQHMLDCLLTGQPCESDGTEYLKSVMLVEACYQSASKNKVIHLLD